MKNDADGDRMKGYEMEEAGRRLMPLLPVMVRIDGKCFSKFTNGLKRPYDVRMSLLMEYTMRNLVKEYNALIGYTQSDEISLILYSDNVKSQIPYDGRIQKLVGDMASFASLTFNEHLVEYIPEKTDSRPRFDCRVWNVPNMMEAANTILWREQDATKNSKSMAARAYYSHRDLENKSGPEMMDMLINKGVNWNDYPTFFKRGVFVRREISSTLFTAEEIEGLPEKHEARMNPHLHIERASIETLDMPPFSKVINRVGVIFNSETPDVEG